MYEAVRDPFSDLLASESIVRAAAGRVYVKMDSMLWRKRCGRGLWSLRVDSSVVIQRTSLGILKLVMCSIACIVARIHGSATSFNCRVTVTVCDPPARA